MATRSRTRTAAPKPYSGPYGTPLAHVHYRQGRHLHPQRYPFTRHETPVTLRLLDVSKESLDNVRQVADSIKRLLVPSLKLQTVPEPLICHLQQLQRLDLGHNQLTDSSFPDAMRSLEQLIELRLNNNKLSRVPSCLRRMKQLARLDMSHNQLESPAGLDKVKQLQVLILDGNKLTSLFKDISGMRKLEMLRCSNNKLRDVPRDVRNLRHLKDMDLSENRITALPVDVFQLPRMESLNAAHNQVGKIPSFNVKVQNKHVISSVDLSNNNLVRFPGHLLQLTSRLDLASNRIRTLAWSSVKRAEGDQEVELGENPLQYPPQNVCQAGLKAIRKFFMESQADVKTYQGVKVVFIGGQGSGKTSLVHSLVDNQARLADDVTEAAVGVDAYEMSIDYDVEEDGKPGKSLNLCLWDLCGAPFYLYPHYLLQEQPSITVLTFSLPDYDPAAFTQQIGSWFDWLIAKTNKLVVIVVGTQSDRVSPKRVRHIVSEVPAKLAAHLKIRQDMIQARMKEIEKREVISPTLSEQLKAYMKLLQAKFNVQTEVMVTSSAKMEGVDKLREAIETLSSDRRLFPNVMRVIPTFWAAVEGWAEERGNSLLVPVMRWEEYSEEVTQRYGMKHLLIEITQYLHDTGKVLWFSGVPSLKDLVFLRPSWFFDVLKQILRHDLDTVTFTPDESLRGIALTPAKFDRLKQEVLNEGVLDNDLMKGFLVSIIPADVNSAFLEVMNILTEGLEMGYPVAKRPQDRDYTWGVDRDSEDRVQIPKLLIPWFRRSDEPEAFRTKWAELAPRRHLAAQFQFPCYMPPGLFEVMTVRAYSDKHKLQFLAHWGGGVHARHKEENVHLMIVYYLQKEQVEEEEEEEGEESLMSSVEVGENATRQGVGPPRPTTRQVDRNKAKRSSVTRKVEEKPSSPITDQQNNAANVKVTRRDPSPPLPLHISDKTQRKKEKTTDNSEGRPSSVRVPSDSGQGLDSEDQCHVTDLDAITETGVSCQPTKSSPQPIYFVDLNTNGPSPAGNLLDTEHGNKVKSPSLENEGSALDDVQNGRAAVEVMGNTLASEAYQNVTEKDKFVDETECKDEGFRGKENGVDYGEHLVSDSDIVNEFTRNSDSLVNKESPEAWMEGEGKATSAGKDKRRKKRTADSGEDNGTIVLKFELRDDSRDVQDQTPASSMWNILLPLLQDCEQLLQTYPGVLVERRTECPFCGDASFPGDWLTPKETQALNTRTCSTCSQHVDTAFLVQPREKKRVVIRGNRFRRRHKPSVDEGGDMTSCEPSSVATSDDVAQP